MTHHSPDTETLILLLIVLVFIVLGKADWQKFSDRNYLEQYHVAKSVVVCGVLALIVLAVLIARLCQ